MSRAKDKRDAERALILAAMQRLGGRDLFARAIADEAGLDRRGIGQKLNAMAWEKLVTGQRYFRDNYITRWSLPASGENGGDAT